MFVMRLTAAGNLDWAGSIVGAAGRNVAVDASGVLNVVGSYLNTVDFDTDVNETFKLTTPKQNGFRLRLRQS